MRALGKIILTTLVFIFFVSGCAGLNLFATPTPISTATPTEEPMAARVNGEGITIAEYQHELELLQSAQKESNITVDAPAQKTMVLDTLVSQVLLSQAAAANGHTVSDAELQQKITSITTQMGVWTNWRNGKPNMVTMTAPSSAPCAAAWLLPG